MRYECITREEFYRLVKKPFSKLEALLWLRFNTDPNTGKMPFTHRNLCAIWGWKSHRTVARFVTQNLPKNDPEMTHKNLAPAMSCDRSRPKSDPRVTQELPALLKPKPKPKENITCSEFDQWWEIYPKKVSKGAARRAFNSALKKTSLENLLSAVSEGRGGLTAEPQFIPHPSSWLNGERWADDAPTATEEAREAEMQAAIERKLKAYEEQYK